MFRILADENMPLVNELFDGVASKIRQMPGRKITNSDLKDIDVLLVRSITQVNADLLQGTPVRFVGSATIGTDHIDLEWLASHDIAFSNSPGCNADSVADYVMASISLWLKRTGQTWLSKTAAVIGCGNVGSRVVKRLENVGLTVLCNDPYKAAISPETFVSLQDALSADIICVHTPLTKHCAHPTFHLLDEQELAQIKSGSLILNAGRGPVIAEQAMLQWLGQGKDLSLVLDVWEYEPVPTKELMEQCLIATPHIAGYSLDGRIRGSWMLRQALDAWSGGPGIKEPVSTENMPSNYHWSPELSFEQNIDIAINRVMDVTGDSMQMITNLGKLHTKVEISKKFDLMRKEYGIRRELSCLIIDGVPSDYQARVKAVGFQC